MGDLQRRPWHDDPAHYASYSEGRAHQRRVDEERIAELERDKMALSLAINERMEHDRARIAALEAENECESCGCTQRIPKDDMTCRGCGMVVCAECCEAFGHPPNRGGSHGAGDPTRQREDLRDRIAALEAERDAWVQAARDAWALDEDAPVSPDDLQRLVSAGRIEERALRGEREK